MRAGGEQPQRKKRASTSGPLWPYPDPDLGALAEERDLGVRQTSRGPGRTGRAVTLWPEADNLSVTAGGLGGPKVGDEEAGQEGPV